MSDFDEDNDRDDDDDREDEDEDDLEDQDGLPRYGFILSGMECLNDNFICGASFVRGPKGSHLDVRYVITEENMHLLSAPFHQYDSPEAYLTLLNEEDERVTTIIMSDLKLEYMSVSADIEGDDDMTIDMTYTIDSFTQKLERKQNDDGQREATDDATSGPD